MANRFFAFGCSFTDHCWPTWANSLGEILRRSDMVKYTYNFGGSGSSNKCIAHSVLLATQLHNIDAEDYVYVQWTTHDRMDNWGVVRDKNPEILHAYWHKSGSIFHSDYDYKVIDQTYTPQQAHMDDLMYKAVVRSVLPGAVYVNYDKAEELERLNNYATAFPNRLQGGIKPLKADWKDSNRQERDNFNQDNIGNVPLCRNPRTNPDVGEAFFPTDTMIDPHPSPMVNYEYACTLVPKTPQNNALNTALSTVKEDIVKYTNTVNKLLTDGYSAFCGEINQPVVTWISEQELQHGGIDPQLYPQLIKYMEVAEFFKYFKHMETPAVWEPLRPKPQDEHAQNDWNKLWRTGQDHPEAEKDQLYAQWMASVFNGQ